MKPVSTYEFHQRHGRLLINGLIYEFISYEDYIDWLTD